SRILSSLEEKAAPRPLERAKTAEGSRHCRASKAPRKIANTKRPGPLYMRGIKPGVLMCSFFLGWAACLSIRAYPLIVPLDSTNFVVFLLCLRRPPRLPSHFPGSGLAVYPEQRLYFRSLVTK